MNKSKEEKILHDHLTGGISFRNLALKYGISHSRAYRIVKNQKPSYKQVAIQEEVPDDVTLLTGNCFVVPPTNDECSPLCRGLLRSARNDDTILICYG